MAESILFRDGADVIREASTSTPLPVTIGAGDIEIGAVELKDGATDTRATINAANTARTTATTVVAVQQVDEAGNVGGVDLRKIAGQTAKQGVILASSVVTGEQNVLPEAIYRTTPLSKIDGQVSLIESDSAGNEKVTQATQLAGEDLTNQVMKVQVQATYTVPLTASALVKTGAGQLMGLVINSCAAGATIKVWDNTSAATTVLLDTITFTAAVNQGPTIIALPAVKFNTGCYITIAVAAMSVTPLWN